MLRNDQLESLFFKLKLVHVGIILRKHHPLRVEQVLGELINSIYKQHDIAEKQIRYLNITVIHNYNIWYMFKLNLLRIPNAISFVRVNQHTHWKISLCFFAVKQTCTPNWTLLVLTQSGYCCRNVRSLLLSKYKFPFSTLGTFYCDDLLF